MASRRRQGRGKRQNAEGMHGDRTHEALIDRLQHGLPEPADPALRDEAQAAARREAAEGRREPRSRREAASGDGASDIDGESAARREPRNLEAHLPGPDGKHRLEEDRQQHDEADMKSEKNRAAKEGVEYVRKARERAPGRGPRKK